MTTWFEEWKAAVFAPAACVIWPALSLIVAIAGPFGSYEDLPLSRRLIYWPLVVTASFFMGAAIRVWVRRQVVPYDFWRATPLVASLHLVTFTPFLSLVTPVFLGPDREAPTPWEFAFFVLLTSLGVSTLQAAIRGHIRVEAREASAQPEQVVVEQADPPETMPEPVRPRLMQRLGVSGEGRLIRISGRNHHVEVVTDLGQETVLIRFADAMTEAEPVEGLQVHRSHWVAVDAVRGCRRQEGRLLLDLVDGSEVPVSRNFRDVVIGRALGCDEAAEAAAPAPGGVRSTPA